MDDDLPTRRDDPLALLARQDLDPLSISELEKRIALLKSEITRTEVKMKAAGSHMQAADELFKK